jgi:hypothetical protein
MYGWINYNGVEFFLENGRNKPPFFPSELIPRGFCPHKTQGEPKKWNNGQIGVFWSETGENVFQDNVEVTACEFIYTGTACLSQLKPLLSQTNYVPLLVTNFRMDKNWEMFLQKLHNEVIIAGRSVVLTGDNYIPLPKFVKRL